MVVVKPQAWSERADTTFYCDDKSYEYQPTPEEIAATKRHIDIRGNGSVGKSTIENERRYLRRVDAAIGIIPICKVIVEDIEGCPP